MTDPTIDLNAYYTSISNIPPSLLPQTFTETIPAITNDDVLTGSIQRYFVRQSNLASGYISEISKDDFNRLKNSSLYTTVEITWRISGPLDDKAGSAINNPVNRLYTGVTSANRMSLDEADKILPGMSSRIINLTQFYNF